MGNANSTSSQGLHSKSAVTSTLNPVVRWETYPLHTLGLFAKLAGCAKFSKFDLAQAYQQVTLDSETSDVLIITTRGELFWVKRLQFGVAVAVTIFQKCMEELSQALEGMSFPRRHPGPVFWKH